MPIDFSIFNYHPRILMDVQLQPIQGARFQPTGFPDLGAATYRHADKELLLVESAQSMANRLEAVCWDDANDDLTSPLKGLPYIRVVGIGETTTNSILESHRINSPYILAGVDDTFLKAIKSELGDVEVGRVDLRQLARVLLKYDINSVVHGVFLEKISGRMRLPRLVSAFIEAEDISVVASGGVKKDEVDPKGNTNKGFGHVPFPRDEYTAEKITAYFNFDLAQLRGYGLPKEAEALLIALTLYKIQKFLTEGLRLRTACDLEPNGPMIIRRPTGFTMPTLEALEKELPTLIKAASKYFAAPVVTEVKYKKA